MENNDILVLIKSFAGVIATGVIPVLYNYTKHYDIITKFLGLFKGIKYSKEEFANDMFGAKTDLVVEDFREIQIFKKYTGIYAEKQRREMLIDFHEKYSKAVSWQEIKSGYGYFDFTGTNIKTRIEKKDKMSYSFSIIISLILLCTGGALAFWLMLYSKEYSHKENVALLINIISIFSLAIFIFFMQHGLSCAIKISKLLKE